jgi:diacylglycerol kinase
MEWLSSTVLWALGFVFAFSGASKLGHVRLTAMALVDLGLAARARAGAGLAAAAYELTLAAALFAAAAGVIPPRAAAAGALLTLAAFTVLLVRVLRTGAELACNCFGASSRLVSGRDVVRNAALCVAGLAALVGPSTIDGAHVPSAPVTAAAALLGVVLLAAAMSLRGVNADPLGDDINRWEQRAYGN